jgi:fucose 4-O-acetylase-like acetyltransferase
VGILLVVLGHNWAVLHEKGELFRVIFSFHLPLFFLSGVVLNESNTFRQFLITRLQSLLKPYFAVLLIIGACKMVLEGLKTRGIPSSSWGHIEGIFHATGRSIDWIPMWFLPHLFVVSGVAFLAIKLTKSNTVMWIFATASLITGYRLLRPTDLPWSMDLLPLSLPFMLLGYVFRNAVKSMAFDTGYFILAFSFFFLLHWSFVSV